MSTQLTLPTARPIPGVLFGLTHTPDGAPIVRESKILKVGIGLPKGRSLHVWMHRTATGDVTWRLTRGFKKDESAAKQSTLEFKTRAEVEAAFTKHLPGAPICNYPRKLSYFTFTRPTMMDLGGGGQEEIFVPDFEAIECHGATPTEIDVVM